MLARTAAAAAVTQLTVHTLWPVAADSPELTGEALERLVGYITRYAQTLGIAVHAVGGTGDHLHVLLNLPMNLSPEKALQELQRATVRFLRDALRLTGFAWSFSDTCLAGVSPENVEDIAAYLAGNAERHRIGDTIPEWEFSGQGETVDENEVPAWLREMLPAEKNEENGNFV